MLPNISSQHQERQSLLGSHVGYGPSVFAPLSCCFACHQSLQLSAGFTAPVGGMRFARYSTVLSKHRTGRGALGSGNESQMEHILTPSYVDRKGRNILTQSRERLPFACWFAATITAAAAAFPSLCQPTPRPSACHSHSGPGPG